MHRIGFLAPGTPPPARQHQAFLQVLRDLGYVEGQTVAIEYRWAEERDERLPELAAELVKLEVDLILGGGTAAARAARGASATIPIVFGASNDPVEAGLVASLAHPGGNVTGLSLTAPALDAKRLELLREAVPNGRRVAVLAHASDATVERDWDETRAAARTLGLEARRYDVQGAEDFEAAFSAMVGQDAEVLCVLASNFLTRHRARIANLAAEARLPAMYEQRLFTDEGGLMSYGPDVVDLYRRAATFIDKIIKGAKPADLPVEQPTKYDFVVNLMVARALGLTIPPSVLAQATEVIQ